MQRGALLFIFGLLLVGQGCFTPAAPVSLEPTDTRTTAEAPDGQVAFHEGFGVLPGNAPTAPITAESRPSVILDAALPAIPPEVTVLREWQSTPSVHLLRNITTAVGIPSGAFGNTPQGETLSLTWTSADGYAWAYEAPAHTLMVTHPSPPRVASAQSSEQILAATHVFLADHGMEKAGWGEPEVFPSSSGPWRVTFSASRDVQPVTHGDGEFLRAGELTGMGQTVTEGIFELPRSLDRSNYPALSSGELLQRLRVGGTNPVVNAPLGSTISFKEFSLVLYRHEGTVNDKIRIFYLPAVYARGILRNGATAIPYSTVVPLVQDDAFEKIAQ